MIRMTLLACLCGLIGSEIVWAADPRLEKVLADWQKRQQRFDAAEYQVRGLLKVPKGAYSNDMAIMLYGTKAGQINPSQDVEGTVGFTVLLDFVKGRHRRDIQQRLFDPGSGHLGAPIRMKDVFNGSQMKCLIPKEENPGQYVSVTQPELTITSGNMKNGEFKNEYYPLFFAHGRIHTDREPILPGKLRHKIHSDYMYVHDTGVLDERKCLILRTQPLPEFANKPFEEYWVDTERDSAVVRYVRYVGPKPLITFEIRVRYRQYQDSWLPDGWRWTTFIKGKTLYYQEMLVAKVDRNPLITDADFEVGEIKAGMLVEERTDLPTADPATFPKSKLSVYRVQDNGTRQDIPDPAHREGDQYSAHRTSSRLWIYMSLGIPGTLVLLVLLWKKRHCVTARAK